MPANESNFIVATSALWAGDFNFFEELLRDYSSPWPRDVGSLEGQEHFEAPEDLIRADGALRLRQLWQRKGEFKRLTRDYQALGIEIREAPLILQTRHLRATVWRISEREFSMQAYLKDLAWQEALFVLADMEAHRNEPLIKTRPPLEPLEEGDAVRGSGARWTVFGNPFIQVELTDLGLLVVSALWIEPVLPENAEAITTKLSEILRALD